MLTRFLIAQTNFFSFFSQGSNVDPEEIQTWVCDPFKSIPRLKNTCYRKTFDMEDEEEPPRVFLTHLFFTGTTSQSFILELSETRSAIIPPGRFPARFFDLEQTDTRQLPENISLARDETLTLKIVGPLLSAGLIGYLRN